MQNGRRTGRGMFPLAGWLFADLLLAMMMIFIVASAVGTYIPPSPKPTPTPKPTASPRLELRFHRFTINIDPVALLGNNPSSINDVKRQVKSQVFLRGRSAGLVIVYGGALNDAGIDTALNIADKIYAVLAELGREGFVFSRASQYDPLYIFGSDPTIVAIDVFLFSQ